MLNDKINYLEKSALVDSMRENTFKNFLFSVEFSIFALIIKVKRSKAKKTVPLLVRYLLLCYLLIPA